MVNGYKLLTAIAIDNEIGRLEGEIKELANEEGTITLETHNLIQELESYERAINADPECYGINPAYRLRKH